MFISGDAIQVSLCDHVGAIVGERNIIGVWKIRYLNVARKLVDQSM